MHTFLIVLEIILAVVIIVAVLLQPSKTQGLGGMITGTTDRFFSKNKSRTYEAMLSRLTVVTAILFAVVTIALNLNL